MQDSCVLPLQALRYAQYNTVPQQHRTTMCLGRAHHFGVVSDLRAQNCVKTLQGLIISEYSAALTTSTATLAPATTILFVLVPRSLLKDQSPHGPRPQNSHHWRLLKRP